MSKLTRLTLVTGAFRAATPGNISGEASNKSFDDLAEAKRLIAALIANDNAITAAEEAGDKKQARTLEKQHRAIYRDFMDFSDRVHNEPPSTWLDIVIRAEIAGYMISWNKPRIDWDEMLEWAEDNGDSYDGMHELVVAVLYLAARSASEQPNIRPA
jgi:hypothetical protein